MTSSNTFKKFISLGAAALLAIGGSLVAAEPASATPVTNIKNFYYSETWTPGTSFTPSMTSTGVTANSALLMSDVTALRGKTLTISSTSSPAGSSDYAQISFYTSLQNATNRSSQIGTNLNIGAGNTTPAVVPQTAVAMRVNFSTSWWSSTARAIATYTSMPSMAADGTTIPVTTATTGPALYQDPGQASSFNAYGISEAFTTPSSGSNMYVNADVTGCIDLSRVSSNTTYTATLKVNGSAATSPGYVMQEHVDMSAMNPNPSPPVSGSTGSFSTNTTLAGWLSGQKQIEITANGYTTASTSTLYDFTLEIVDQNNQSLLKDCTPVTPSTTGTLSYTSNTVRFTPDTAVSAAGAWGVKVYKSSDDTLVASTTGSGNTIRTLNYVVNGVSSAWPSGDYYAKVYTRASFGMGAMTYLNSAESSARTATLTIGGGASPSPTPTVSSPPSSETARQLPVWTAPILKQIPTLSKTLTTEGGKVNLKDGDYSTLKNVTVGGKEVAFSIDAKGDVNIPVPSGKAGTTADLVVEFTGGRLIIQDGIKYVAPTDVASVVERPVSITAGTKKITEAVADQIRQAAFANLNNTTIQCVAYSASNSVKAKAAAELAAVQACGIAAKANPGLKIADVSVVVDKTKARKAAVGIKVYK